MREGTCRIGLLSGLIRGEDIATVTSIGNGLGAVSGRFFKAVSELKVDRAMGERSGDESVGSSETMTSSESGKCVVSIESGKIVERSPSGLAIEQETACND